MILAIETSCDESALALFEPGKGFAGEWVASQIELHRAYGGVVPDLAARAHRESLLPLWNEAQAVLADRGQTPDLIAVTRGPGLAGCLALGITLGKALALRWSVPLIGVNHLRGHACSPFLAEFLRDPESFSERLPSLFPHLGLIVSGGNTLVFRMDHPGHLEVVAETMDDALGEALDKGAKLLGLPYPGGPELERLSLSGDPRRHVFPVAIPEAGEWKFSFSGLKTSLRYRLEKMSETEFAQEVTHLAASYQEAAFRQIERKLRHILAQCPVRSFGLSGGVSHNKNLTERLKRLSAREGLAFLKTEGRHAGDNAGMIAFAAWWQRNFAPDAPLPEGSVELDFDPSWVI